MKSSCQLDLVVRKSAGSELFPGESSGYNSSASSVTGDQSPSWSDSKRLSMVKEESADLEDRLAHLDRYKSAKQYEWADDEEKHVTTYKPTVINLSENGITIRNNGVEEEQLSSDESAKLVEDVRVVSQQVDKKTVVVEIHRNNVDCSGEVEDTNCSSSGSSLSSALAMELQRRREVCLVFNFIYLIYRLVFYFQKMFTSNQTIDEKIQKKKILKGINSDKQEQHTKLMDEFKRAHKKMFQSEEKPKVTDNVSTNSQ